MGPDRCCDERRDKEAPPELGAYDGRGATMLGRLEGNGEVVGESWIADS